MELGHIEFSKLSISALNMRHGKKAPDVSDILPSIRARGILVPLLVRQMAARTRSRLSRDGGAITRRRSSSMNAARSNRCPAPLCSLAMTRRRSKPR
jgi:hypothetical protein